MAFWPLTNCAFPNDQTFQQFHDLDTELDFHRIMNGFHGVFATFVTSQQGTLTLPDTWFRPPFWDLLVLQLLRPDSSNLPCLYSTFHLEYTLVLSRFCSFNPFQDSKGDHYYLSMPTSFITRCRGATVTGCAPVIIFGCKGLYKLVWWANLKYRRTKIHRL